MQHPLRFFKDSVKMTAQHRQIWYTLLGNLFTHVLKIWDPGDLRSGHQATKRGTMSGPNFNYPNEPVPPTVSDRFILTCGKSLAKTSLDLSWPHLTPHLDKCTQQRKTLSRIVTYWRIKAQTWWNKAHPESLKEIGQKLWVGRVHKDNWNLDLTLYLFLWPGDLTPSYLHLKLLGHM